MKLLAGALLPYGAAVGWATILAGPAGTLVSIIVLGPFTIFGVVILEAQREKHRHQDRWELRPVRQIRG